MMEGIFLLWFVLPYRSIGDESYSREIFEEYITYLKEKAKEKERKREEEKVHNFICLSFWFHNSYTCLIWSMLEL